MSIVIVTLIYAQMEISPTTESITLQGNFRFKVCSIWQGSCADNLALQSTFFFRIFNNYLRVISILLNFRQILKNHLILSFFIIVSKYCIGFVLSECMFLIILEIPTIFKLSLKNVLLIYRYVPVTRMFIIYGVWSLQFLKIFCKRIQNLHF